MERISTGVKGLDDLIQGGFPKSSSILLSGEPGTGKTILSLQYLLQGVENGEKTVYVSLDEETEQIIEQAKQFGWDIESAIKKGKLEIINVKPKNFKTRFNKFNFKEDVERIVVDSISSIIDIEDDKPRALLHGIITGMKEHNATVIYISEIGEDGGYSRDTVSEYVCDGVIKLDARSMGSEMERTLRIVKMRSTKMDGSIKSLEFTDDGIKVE